MPVVFRWKGCKFFFFSNEGDPREPLHIHVRCHGALAKFWLEPVAVVENIGFAAYELTDLARVVSDHRQQIERVWHEHFGD
ncbi:MAG: DUF4160 domain-containing protein [Rhodocyclaceae bacterium]|nr:DUF4160 domain-containing protein [Rhodocyclaceae bacterium]